MAFSTFCLSMALPFSFEAESVSSTERVGPIFSAIGHEYHIHDSVSIFNLFLVDEAPITSCSSQKLGEQIEIISSTPVLVQNHKPRNIRRASISRLRYIHQCSSSCVTRLFRRAQLLVLVKIHHNGFVLVNSACSSVFTFPPSIAICWAGSDIMFLLSSHVKS